MNTDYTIEKILEVSEQLKDFKDNSQVLVMHPSTMMLVREHVTRYHDIYNTREAFSFDGRIPLYLSFRLPVNHFSMMTEKEYRDFEKN